MVITSMNLVYRIHMDAYIHTLYIHMRMYIHTYIHTYIHSERMIIHHSSL